MDIIKIPNEQGSEQLYEETITPPVQKETFTIRQLDDQIKTWETRKEKAQDYIDKLKAKKVEALAIKEV